MRTVDLILKKRDGEELGTEEIAFLIRGYTEGSIPDYQMSAWAMAVFFRGMSARETADLTLEIAASGDRMDLSAIRGITVDKHSTGGVGDTTTLILAPLVAAAGVPVAKMSGRGLGHTGGTIDKLEAIPGFTVERTREQFLEQVSRVGAAVISQSGNITPADKKLYGLRDVTGTVNSIPLIASSVMSKKIASGAQAIVLDVKTGGGAFMKTLDDSIALAQAMVGIGSQVGRETVALITGMEQPLGRAIGNALEVKEAIGVLKGGKSGRLERVTLELGSHMLVLGKKADSLDEARSLLKKLIDNGAAAQKLKEMISAQGGDERVVDDPSLLPSASKVIRVASALEGFVTAIQAEEIGLAAMMLGAGRATKDSVIDLGVGVVLHREIGDQVHAGDALAELHVNGNGDMLFAEVENKVREAFQIGKEPVKTPPLIYAVVTQNGVERIG